MLGSTWLIMKTEGALQERAYAITRHLLWALLATIVVPGLSLGILLGALVIVFAWVLTWTYVRWANTHYDAALRGLRK